jgi:REP element-mobilizing transposase RayT
MNAFKSKSTRICWNHGMHGKVWQGRFYDHILRKNEDIKTVAEYILHNPVRKGIVKDWRDYEYCGLLDAPEI